MRPSTLADTSGWRPEVRPPSLVMAPSGWWQRTLFHLLNPGHSAVVGTLAHLDAVRRDFEAQLADSPAAGGAEVAALTERIANARSLRELWHLRMAVYTHIATHASQADAETRLERLNRHFAARPARSPIART